MVKRRIGRLLRSRLAKNGAVASGFALVMATSVNLHLRSYTSSGNLLLDIYLNICPKVTAVYPKMLKDSLLPPLQSIGADIPETCRESLIRQCFHFAQMEEQGTLRELSSKEYLSCWDAELSPFIEKGLSNCLTMVTPEIAGISKSGWVDLLLQAHENGYPPSSALF